LEASSSAGRDEIKRPLLSAQLSAAQAENMVEAFRIASVIALICGLMAASFIMGVGRRMDHKLEWGPLNDVWHLSVAISKDVYGLQGYVGFRKVFNTLQHSLGIRNFDDDDLDMPALSDKTVLNTAINKAASIDELRGLGSTFPQTLEAYKDGLSTTAGNNLMSPSGEDLGESDLYALAFRLFGFRIESAYYLFFLLIGISIVAYLVQFWRRPTALAVLLLNVCAFHVFFYLEFFGVDVPTVYTNRFASTICIIPICHFLFLLIERRRPTLAPLALAAVQLTIFAFGLFIRSSGNWAVLAAVVLFLMLFATAIVRQRQAPLMIRCCAAARAMRIWPLAIFLGGVAGLSCYVNTVPHPIFRTLDNQPHHMRWHSAWIGLSHHPDWPKYFPDLPSGTDATAQIMSRRIWVERGHSVADFDSSLVPDGMRIGVHEDIVREQYLKFVQAHPLYFFEVTFYYKPIEFYNLVRELALTIDRGAAIPILATLLSVGLLTAGRRAQQFSAWSVCGVTALVFICSMAPIMLAYPAPHVIADQVWTLTAFILALGAAIVCVAIRLASVARRTAASSEHSARPGGERFSAGFGAISMVVLALLGVLMWRAQLPSINILNVHYANCAPGDPALGDDISNGTNVYLPVTARICDGRRECTIGVYNSSEPIGDQIDSCKKQLRLSWRCGISGPVNNTDVAINPYDGHYNASMACR
jgi:hypothetical protein